MKKGFTLIELLMVMVIVGILVTVALPKYQASLERGRATEAVTNLRAASDYANTRYVMDGNTYIKGNIVDSSNMLLGGDFTKKSYFGTPMWYSGNATTAVFSISRENGGYDLYAVNKEGELKYISCSGDQEMCFNAGMEEVSFTDPYANTNLVLDFQ